MRVRRTHLPTALVLAGLVWSVSGCVGERPRLHVILVVVDTLRADHMGMYGYARPTTPNIDAIAAEAVVFENAVPTCPATAPSVASILTGLHRASHAVRKNGTRLPIEVETLPEVLRAHGYYTAAVISNPVIDTDKGFGQGFDTFLNPPSIERVIPGRGGPGLGGSAVVREVTRILKEQHEAPIFLFIHLMDPHGPYYPPDEYQRLFNPEWYQRPGETDLPLSTSNYGLGVIPQYQRVGEHRSPADFRARYDADIRYADDHVGAIVRLLHETDLWDKSLFVLTADHGESLGEHDQYFQHGWFLYDDSLWVPLLIRGPASLVGRGRVPQTMSLIDVAPTILDLLGLAGTEDMEGRSLMPLIRGEESDRPVFAETYYGNRLVALRLGEMKYILTPPPPTGGWPGSDGWKPYWPTETREELYDLERDPEELLSMATTEEDLVRSMRNRLHSWLSEQQEKAKVRPTERLIGRAIEQQLRSLGYTD